MNLSEKIMSLAMVFFVVGFITAIIALCSFSQTIAVTALCSHIMFLLFLWLSGKLS